MVVISRCCWCSSPGGPGTGGDLMVVLVLVLIHGGGSGADLTVVLVLISGWCWCWCSSHCGAGAGAHLRVVLVFHPCGGVYRVDVISSAPGRQQSKRLFGEQVVTLSLMLISLLHLFMCVYVSLINEVYCSLVCVTGLILHTLFIQ